MLGAFQTSGFQRNAFQIETGGVVPPVPTPVSKGGFDEHSYKRYRKHLEELTEATSEKRKYIKKAKFAAEELIDLPVDTPELEKLLEGPETKGTLRLTPQIDYAALREEINLLTKYLDIVYQQRIKILRELDDEAAFMLMIN